MSPMESAKHIPHQFSLRLDNFEALAEATREWDLDFCQLDSGPFQVGLTQFLTPSTILLECSFSRKIEQRGAPPHGYRTFGFAASAHLDLKWRGKSVGPQNLMLFPPGRALQSISQPGFHIFAFSVSEKTLEEAANRRGLDSVGNLIPSTDLLSCPREVMADLRSRARVLSRSAASHPSLPGDDSFRDSVELDLVDAVLDAIATGSRAVESRPTAQSRTRAVKKALDIITDRAAEPVSVAEIAQITGVTDRTLRYAFEEAYGLSPKQYLQAYRLNRVHRLLRQAHKDGQNVSDVANEWGFWHMGQFARDYKRMFETLPGKTIQVN